MPITTTPSGGPQGEYSTYTPIYSTTLSGTASSVTLSNIPQTYTDLELIITCKSSSTTGNYVNLQFNGDTSTNYSSLVLAGNGTSASSVRWSNRNNLTIDYWATPHNTEIGMRKTSIMNYSNTTTYKTILSRASRAGAGADCHTGTWRSNSPITSITINLDSDTFASGSTFTLYGIKAAATQFIPTKAAGGDVVVSDGTYAYHVFKSTGVFSAAQALTADVLTIAGGGGAGKNGAGGGGAGGIFYATSQSFSSGSTYAVTVGAGGSSQPNNGGGFNGNNSQFGSLTVAVGGGAGGSNVGPANGAAGGCGGGSYAVSSSGGATTQTSTGGTGYGFKGGDYVVSNSAGGGGGTGQAGNTNGGSQGGDGTSVFSSWGAATNTGVASGGTYYYAGGGGGGSNNLNATGAGGKGGGGGDGVPGTTNTGSGGGAAWNTTISGGGGSGLVIVRYAL